MKTIKNNEKMETIDFFGFHVAENAIGKQVFLDLPEDEDAVGCFSLFINGEPVTTINWLEKFSTQDKKVFENEIWEYILNSCKKFTKNKIYIDKFYVEELYRPLALSINL